MKVLKTQKLAIESLVMDFNIYPRHQVNETRVNEYIVSLNAGAKFPPIKVDAKTNRIADGFHRYNAFKKAGLAQIEADMCEFEDEKELIWWGINWNANHGLKLTTYDMARCMILAETYGLEEDMIVSALSITITKFEDIKARRIRNIEPATKIRENTKFKFQPVAVKRIISEATKDTVTEKQIEEQKSMGGMRAKYYVSEAVKILENDLLNVNDKNIQLVEQLIAIANDWIKEKSIIAV